MKYLIDNQILTPEEAFNKMLSDIQKSVQGYSYGDDISFVAYDYGVLFGEPKELRTFRDIYEALYKIKKVEFIKEGLTEDKASRRANIYAVKNTTEEYYRR